MRKLSQPIEAFCDAIAPREKWTPSQWAERAPRILTVDETSEPGPWKNDRTPYMVGIMDSVVDAAVEETVVLKGAQVAWSEAARNILGFWIDLDPGPCLIVCPDQQSAEDMMEERIKPLVRSTPAVARHLTGKAGDAKKTSIRFDTMRIFLAWAGSSQRLKSRPIRYLNLEEPDEYPAESGAGGDPISKALKRLTTFSDKGLARVLTGGTPTTREGAIMRRWDLCGDHRFYFVPCPHCSKFQKLQWRQVKWPALTETDFRKKADVIESQNLAYYECEHCQKEIRDHHKPEMLRRGIWVGEDQAVTLEGKLVGAARESKRVGFFLPGLYSPWLTFGKMAAEWLMAQDNKGALRDFINQRLAEAFETITTNTPIEIIQEKMNGAPPALIIPGWAVRLLATADTQGNSEKDGYFYYTIRAWGTGWRSQLIDSGIVSTKEELYAACFQRTFEIAGTPNRVHCQSLLIDSGGPRWQEVYSFSQSDPTRIKPSKGANVRLGWMMEKHVQKDHGIVLWFIDTNQTKDQLHGLIYNADRTLWLLNDRMPHDYLLQMTSEQKVLEKNGKEVWQLKPNRPPNHFWDCEHLQIASAWQEGCGMTAIAVPAAASPSPQPPSKPRNTEAASWMPPKPENWTAR